VWITDPFVNSVTNPVQLTKYCSKSCILVLLPLFCDSFHNRDHQGMSVLAEGMGCVAPIVPTGDDAPRSMLIGSEVGDLTGGIGRVD
jgi:hypothetical protein